MNIPKQLQKEDIRFCLLKKGELLKPLAKENLHIATGGKKSLTLPKSAKSIDVREEVAKIAKVSHDTVDKVKFIEAKADEETRKELDKGNKKLSINKVYNQLKKAENRIKIKEKFQQPQLPNKKKYNIIYADPPWSFKHYSDKGKEKSPDNYYNTMNIEEIKKLPISNLTAEDCILFMWVTYPMLEKCFEVIKAWGFEYKTVGFTWVKKNKVSDSWFWGMGYWTRSNAEICIIATKGSPIRQSNSVHQIIDTPIEEHSKKPDCVRNKIVELMGNLPRIELFAREKVEGWDAYGDEIK